MKGEKVLELVAGLDGHGIFDGAKLVADYPCPMIERLTRNHCSGAEHKETIYVEGKPVEELRGVYGLDLLAEIARAVEADTSEANRYLGRGKKARALAAAIFATVDKDEDYDLQ